MSVWLLCCVLMLLIPVVAKAEAPLPVIDPATIFADGVTVLETLPVVTWDDDARVLNYFDPATMTWGEYAYPDALTEIVRQDEYYNNGPVILLNNPGGHNMTFVGDKTLWQFNPATKVFEPAEKICGLPKTSASGLAVWRFIRLAGEDDYRLCNNYTGEMTDTLNLIVMGEDFDNCQLAVIPEAISIPHPGGNDVEWLVYPDCFKQRSIKAFYMFSVHAYHLPEHEDYQTGMTEPAQQVLLTRGYPTGKMWVQSFADPYLNRSVQIYALQVGGSEYPTMTHIAESSAIGIGTYTVAEGDGFTVYQYDSDAAESQVIIRNVCQKRPHCNVIQIDPHIIVQAYSPGSDETLLEVYNMDGTPLYQTEIYFGGAFPVMNGSGLMYTTWHDDERNPNGIVYLNLDTLDETVIAQGAYLSDEQFASTSNYVFYQQGDVYKIYDIENGKTYPVTRPIDYGVQISLEWDNENTLTAKYIDATNRTIGRWRIDLPQVEKVYG